MIGKTILHYQILENLPSTPIRTGGEGGMGIVFKAEDTKLKRDVERKRFKIDKNPMEPKILVHI